jgi:N-acetylmuramoyl-L-alanine amidase
MHWNRVAAGRLLAWSIGPVALAAFALPMRPQAPAAAAPRFVVVLDAAHGGEDSGGRLASGQIEKATTLELSVRLRSLLAARGISVVTTREADMTVDPDRRAEIANHAKADACLSLHATESGSGIHLFSSSLAPASPARFVPWRTAQAPWVNRSLALAGVINAALLHASFNVTISRTALIAVDSMMCPALAVEVAPLRAPDGDVTAEPDDPNYQASVANALATALLEWRMEAHQP